MRCSRISLFVCSLLAAESFALLGRPTALRRSPAASNGRMFSPRRPERGSGGRGPPPILRHSGGDGRNEGDSEEKQSIWEKIQRNKELVEDIKLYSSSLVLALTVRTFIVEPRYIPSLSMYPTLDIGDQLAVEKVTKLVRGFRRGDIVVFRPPETYKEMVSGSLAYAGRNVGKEDLIKRIVAVEGDVVEVREGGKVLLNGKEVNERFIAEAPQYTYGPKEVPTGMVLGTFCWGPDRHRSAFHVPAD